MKILKISLILISLIFLNGCFQTSALLGPGMTIVTSGNVLQAGLQYGANTAIKNETGKYPLAYLKDKVDERNNQKKFHANFKDFIEKRIKSSREKLFIN